MTRLLMGIAIALSCLWTARAEPVDVHELAESIERVDVFLLIGQSNMRGRGFLPDDQNVHPRILNMNLADDLWYPAEHPLHQQNPPGEINPSDNSGVGPGLDFARSLIEGDDSVAIALVPCAEGGSWINLWGKGQPFYKNAIRRTQKALADFPPGKARLAGVLWLQGESDARALRIDRYEEKLDALVRDLRHDFKDPDLPFVASTIGSFIRTNHPKYTHAREINEILLALPKRLPRTAAVDARDLSDGHIGDYLHYNAEAQKEIGRRMASKYSRLRNDTRIYAKPNVLLILVDDLGYHDLSCQGSQEIRTPNIDHIAASGVRFTDGYITAPQCGPSRAGLITGVHQNRFGYLDNTAHSGIPPADTVKTIAEQLQDVGYTTGLIGKWHIGEIFTNKETRERTILPNSVPWERGFDYVLMHDSGGSHYFPYRKDGIKWMTDRNRRPELERKPVGSNEREFLRNLPPDTYLTDYFSEDAVRFLTDHQDQPWFLFLSYNAPHTPIVATERTYEDNEHIENHRRRQFAAMMQSLDEGIGGIIEALEETGQVNETLIWFLSDNGGPTSKNTSRNDPFSGVKGTMHEGGIRVPFIVSWPGHIPAGQVLNEPVTSLDILPTSLAAAGVEEISSVYDGIDLLPWLEEESSYTRKQLTWAWRQMAAIRIGSLKETRGGPPTEAVDGTEIPGRIFADLSQNPAELPSLALADPEKRAILSERLDNWLRHVEDDAIILTPSRPVEGGNESIATESVNNE